MVKQCYKQTEIGVIPEDWEVVKLQTIGQIVTGSTPYTNDRSLYGEDYMFIGPSDLGTSKNIFNSIKKTSLKGHLNGRVLPTNSVLVTCIGSTIGKIGINKSEATTNQQINSIIVNENNLYDYIYYSLKIREEFIKSCASQQAVPLLNKNDFSEIQIPLPPLAEQEAIASALSDADAWIESLEQLIAKKRLIKQGAMQSLLTPKEDWESKTLLEIADKKRDLFNDGDWIESEHIIEEGIRLVQTGNIGIGRFLNKGNRKYISEKSFNELKCKELREGDLLICRLAEPAGRACIFPKTEDFKSVTSVDVTIFRPDAQKYNREFLMYIFCTNNWFTDIIEKVGGTTHKRISRGNLGNITIKIPPLSEQERIATILSDMDAELEALETQLGKARQIKQGMMQELLTGKTRLIDN